MYGDKSKRHKSRNWKLQQLNKEIEEEMATEDYDRYMIVLEDITNVLCFTEEITRTSLMILKKIKSFVNRSIYILVSYYGNTIQLASWSFEQIHQYIHWLLRKGQN